MKKSIVLICNIHILVLGKIINLMYEAFLRSKRIGVCD